MVRFNTEGQLEDRDFVIPAVCYLTKEESSEEYKEGFYFCTEVEQFGNIEPYNKLSEALEGLRLYCISEGFIND